MLGQVLKHLPKYFFCTLSTSNILIKKQSSTMDIFKFFRSKSKEPNDPYWEFNEQEHFRPLLNKANFFRLTGYDFGWFVLEPLSLFVDNRNQEIEKGKALSFAQKALYYWWYLDGQVTNGGFVQFYYNGYGHYIPTIIKGLEYIGDSEMTDLVKRADAIYQKNKDTFSRAQVKNLFGSDLYKRLDKLSLLDNEYFNKNKQTIAIIESYFRKHPNEICLDENGKEFDMNFSGLCQTFYENKTIKESFHLEQGVITGAFETFYSNGNPKEIIQYLDGKPSGERKAFFENNLIKYQVSKDPENPLLIHQWFYENGIPKKLESKHIQEDKRLGLSKEWYENGQLKEESNFIDNSTRVGPWLKYWEDGSKQLEADFKNGEVYFQNYWTREGKQLLKNGTGIYISEFKSGNRINIYHSEYKNYQRHGISKNIKNGVVSIEQEFKHGKEDGYTRTFYDNGSIREEKLYKNGQIVSNKKFPKFENPKVKTTILCEMEDEWLINRKLETADTYPQALNNKELAANFNVSADIFKGYLQDTKLSYTYFVAVDEQGQVTKMDFLVADNGFITDEVQANIAKLKFTPAQKDGQAIASYVIVKHQLILGE